MKKLLVLLFVVIFLSSAEADMIRTAVVVSIDDNVLTLLDGAGLIWLYEDIEDLDVFDVVSFALVDTAGTDSILDDTVSQPTYSAIKVDKEWVIKLLVEIEEYDLAEELKEASLW